MLFTDTDSLTYHIKTDVYRDFLADRELFDNSDYPQNSEFYFSDEAAGVPVEGFIGLKSKMYSISKGNGQNSKTAKTIRSDCHQISSYEINKSSIEDGGTRTTLIRVRRKQCTLKKEDRR